ncbi:rod shape-determining protein RodA [Phocaeicola faecicola]|jgi:rod shape determining protein RodA|uniref:rod shape-determining protein RodA n=1 Tax=Phocaeicola faecicola TaxID=2739389 RepID=UPI0015B524CA|nr:rod shape-determining protein RodA [Phocaeicola faecicola]MCI5742061.1 rod shape-determining protein RodA [Bacteroides sp.]MDD6907415.1 rod shape-determining protein RodA [Bacteroidaceae bacterium]MDY4871503.1 rod shape-determining protein RodA [Phocaeicola faecicola]
MAYRKDSIWKTVDWWTIALYVILVMCGWLSICGASYDYGDPDFFSLSTRAGKQLMWIGCSFGLGFVLLMIEERFYDTYAYLIYGILLLLLFGTIFNPHEIKGSRSWIVLGPVSLQPAEFAKFATALALAKYIGEYTFSMEKGKNLMMALGIILVPMVLIVCQKETGSALVYLSFFLVLYREGMTGAVLFSGICAVVYFIVGIRFSEVMMPDECTSWGDFSVMTLIVIFSALLVKAYGKNYSRAFGYILLAGLGTILLGVLFSLYVIPYDVAVLQAFVFLALCIYLVYLFLRERLRSYLYILFFALGSVGFFYSADYVFNDVLEPHQQVRIKVLLGMEDDPTGAGYNVNQSKIAIGSGGFLGKGFLNGTQTKLKYVPEQDTDFIFCTVGEEQGFVGASAVILLFSVFIWRLIWLAERQSSRSGRVYGYCVLSVFFFHLFVNVGMVLGLTPVIGIPLPFFSYGGSSLWGFTILLFVFLRIDASREG